MVGPMLTRATLAVLVVLTGCSPVDASEGEGGTEGAGAAEATTSLDCVPTDTDGFDESSSTGALPEADLSRWDGDPERGVYYRRPTEAERESALLDEDTLLLILPAPVIESFDSGDATVRLPVPIDGELMTLGLEFVGIIDGVPAVEVRWTGECFVRETLHPTFFEYRSAGHYIGQEFDYDGDYIIGRALAWDLRDSVVVTGATANVRFSLDGPYAPDALELTEGLPLGRRSVHIVQVWSKT